MRLNGRLLKNKYSVFGIKKSQPALGFFMIFVAWAVPTFDCIVALTIVGAAHATGSVASYTLFIRHHLRNRPDIQILYQCAQTQA